MNSIERLVYEVVKSNPKLKKQIRNFYQGIFDILPRKKEYSINTILLKESYFYGFHELQPFSEDNSKILANNLEYDELRMPTSKDFINVGYFEFNGIEIGEFVKLGKTNAWNFHKGCRLQWLTNEKVIFNCFINNELVAKIININTKEEDIIPFPIDTVSSCGKFATSFSYERLEVHMPGYGYCHQDNYSYLDEKRPKETGLYFINIENKKRRLLVDLFTLSELTINSEASNIADHYVTHTEFSPDSKYISFLHRWSVDNNGKRFTELMVYNIETNNLFRVPTTDYMTSHYDWNNKNEIIAYCNYKDQDAHVLLKIEDLENSHYVAFPELNSDGHQSFINNTSFLTDTYPDKWRMAKLFRVDINNNSVKLLASVYSPKKFQSTLLKGHVACDLHPTASRDGKFVCFDTVKSGKRAIAIMALD